VLIDARVIVITSLCVAVQCNAGWLSLFRAGVRVSCAAAGVAAGQGRRGPGPWFLVRVSGLRLARAAGAAAQALYTPYPHHGRDMLMFMFGYNKL
jgi:hypothetical protein